MKRIPLSVLVEVIALSVISLLALSITGNGLFYVKRQAIYILIGFLTMYLMLQFDFRELKYLAPLLYIIGFVLLLSVLFLGHSAYGARRWIKIGRFITFQPSELEKPFLIIFFAYVVQLELEEHKKFFLLILSLILPFAAIFKQPDLGTDIVLFSIFIFVMFFFFNVKYFASVVISVVASIPIVFKFLKPYQIKRILTFLDPQKDPLGSGYNVIQSIIAIGSGGLFGRGMGNSTFTKLHFVPVQYADFIFSAIGEAFGFIGALILILLYVGLLLFIIKTYTSTENVFGKAITIGVFAMFLTQIFINIGMCTGIMPVTGIPLPFVSFGGSSTIANFIALGLVVNIYIYREEINISI